MSQGINFLAGEWANARILSTNFSELEMKVIDKSRIK
jgi:hypothetical protein